jgi:multidrug efflux pump subunit AcrA (membrane-fusion protein)
VRATLKIKGVPKIWLIPGLAALFLLVVAGPAVLLSLAPASGPDIRSSPGQETSLIGNLAGEITIDGRLHFPRRLAMTFESGGAVGSVLVREGDKVEKGQILARLDAVTLADLEKAMFSGEVGVVTAQTELDSLAVSSPVALAQAQATAATAEVALDDAREDLTNHLQPEAVDVARAQQVVADTRLALDDAEDSLADLDRDHSQRFSQARNQPDLWDTFDL